MTPSLSMSKPRMIRVLTIALIALLLTLPIVEAALASAGSLDCSFGDWGQVITTYSGTFANTKSLAIYASGPQQGKIVVGVDTNNNMGALRLNNDGSLDSSFGTNGFAPTVDYFGSWDYVAGVAALVDGKVVVAGQADNRADGTNRLGVARYTAAGQLDPTFGTGGVLAQKISAANRDEFWQGAAADSAGNIYVAGKSIDASGYVHSTVVKIGSNGVVSGTWYADFDATINDEGFYGVTVQNDGKVVAGGDYYDGTQRVATVVRFNTNGTLDTTFSGDGLMTFAYGTIYEEVRDLAMQSDGKIVAAFVSSPSASTYDFGVARINSNGTLDTTGFANPTGMVTRHVNTYDFVYRVAVQSNGQIVLAGESQNASGNLDYTLLRYSSSGSPDNTFGNSGILQLDFSNGMDRAYGLAVQTDGKLVVGGYTNGNIGVVRLNDTDFNRRYGAARVTQNTADIEPGVQGDLLHMQICVEGNTGPDPVLTGLTFNTAGTTLPADIDSAQVYFTDQNTTFTTTTSFGSAIANPSGSFTASGSQALTNRVTNYWLAYTIDPAAMLDGSQVVDAQINTITVDGGSYTPVITNPSGTRRIYRNYPDIIGDTSWNDYITNVTYAGIDHPSGNDSGYADYTTFAASVIQGSSATLTGTVYVGDSYYPAVLVAWIDWNHNLSLDDPGEKYVIGTHLNISGTNTTNATITVPTTATLGATRMRVASNAIDGVIEPTTNGVPTIYGEAEDYTVHIVSQTCVSTGSTAWSSAGTWTCGRVPDGNEPVTIASGHTVSLSGNVTQNGPLTLTGDLDTGVNVLTLGASASLSGAGDIIGTVRRTGPAAGSALPFNNQATTFNFTTAPTQLDVTLTKAAPPNANANGGSAFMLPRYYTLTPTGSVNADVCLGYQDSELGSITESQLRLCRWTGTAWSCPARSISSSTATNMVCADGVTDFSNWALGAVGPTAVTIQGFSVASQPIDWAGYAGLGLLLLLALGAAVWRLTRRAQFALNPSSIKFQGDDHVR
jgi:uncharacterized delta-60 repeat protein